ncbi:MAG TPA: aspartate aminotransferase family protein [Dehalococcoidales bacterium]|nr:aspartate aminotransferase family protein [Dehalococcoidales bacterium]
MTSKRTDELLKWDREHIVHSRWAIGGNIGFVIDKSHGIYLQDTEGKEYIDSSSQLVCVNLGYGQTEIIDAIREELEKLQYCMQYLGFVNEASIRCGQKLSEIVPEGLDHFNFTTGGSESIDLALRFARLYWNARGMNKYKIVSLYDSYHGTAGGGLAVTGSGRGGYERGVAPVMPGFIHIPSYYCYRCMFGKEYPSCNIHCAQFLAEIIEKEGADSVAAFIAEPELGTAGMVAPPPEYWPMIREICSKYNVLLITDEVMTGFGRTGKMFALEHWKVKPDIMVMAKGITSAYIPFGAVALSDEIWEALKGRNFVSYTYAGHPACAAGAVKTMEIYQRDKVVENAAKVGKYALERLKRDFEPLPCVGEVGGLGLMLGIEIAADKATKRPFDRKLNIMEQIMNNGLEKGMYIRVCDIGSTPGDRIVFAPPLIITTEEVDKALDILYSIVASLKP